MDVIDSRGRLFGRWNLIDAAMLGALGVVLVLGYGAFLLFRPTVPVVGSVTPAEIVSGRAGTLRVTGDHLRPFLTARLDCSAHPRCESLNLPLLVTAPTRAEVTVQNLAPGSYDFVLFDEARELVRVPAAIRVVRDTPSALAMEVQAAGAFVFVTESAVSLIVPGARLEEAFPIGYTFRPGEGLEGPVGTIVRVSSPEVGAQPLRVAAGEPAVSTSVVLHKLQVPAILTLQCTLMADRCRISGTDLLRDAVVPMALSVPEDQRFTRPMTRVAFRVDEVRPASAPQDFPLPRPPTPPPVAATVRVKIFARTEAAGLPRAGEKDFSLPPAEAPTGEQLRARIVSVDTAPRQVATTVRTADFDFQETMTTFEATFQVPVTPTPTGWQYAGQPIKVGAPFRFEGRTYAISGWIVDVQIGRSVPPAGETQ